MPDDKNTPSARVILHSSASNEWGTPAQYIEAARAVMGHIHLDPCTTERANRRIQADNYFDQAADGLRHPWRGNVWMNPPYGRGGQPRWTAKLLAEYAQGNTLQAVCLVNAVTDTKWFQALWPYPICFVRGRIHFLTEAGCPAGSPTHGSVFVYLGPNANRFIEIFSAFGHVVLPQ